MTEHPGSPYTPDELLRQDGVGVPDAFMRLWTPHRMAYIEGENKPTSSAAGSGCPFCRLPGLPDADALIVHRGESAYAVLNLYPYNPGHLMVVPYRHVADYTELTDQETADVAALTRQAMQAVGGGGRAARGTKTPNTGARRRPPRRPPPTPPPR
ncbi:HIT domain-containing protein, partial [Kribbella sp. NPDC059898]|uniref:HIT domain-containing protein n=1 Tax=Kribbella sp. NPDC059898 TaxID=3346995 RepID=UPI00365D699C